MICTGRTEAVKTLIIVFSAIGSAWAAPQSGAAPAPTTAPASALSTDARPTTTAPAGAEPKVPTTAPAAQAETKPKPRSYFVPSKGLAVRNETQPPGYVKSVDQYGLPKDLSWLEFGALQRTRFELRHDDYRERLEDDSRFMMRSEGYVGIKDILDPIRLGVEFIDARVEGDNYPKNTRDFDQADLLQAFAELYLKDWLGKDRPLRIQFGRMTLDYLDRRLIARSRWSDTQNAFDGFRVQLGQQSNDWELDGLAVMPVDRFVSRRDQSTHHRWLYGLIGDWRRWSKWITIQPYYLALDQNLPDNERNVHTLGLRTYGFIGDTGFDFDTDVIFQYGNDRRQSLRTFAGMAETGYTFKHKWKPRIALLSFYASGDRSPNDNVNNRFDRLYGNGNTFSMLDYFEFTNMVTETVRYSMDPTNKLHVEMLYRPNWLASSKDSWTVPGRRDATGQSGSFVGQSLEVSARYQVLKQLELEMGYAHFMPGSFTRNTGPADDSDFFYVQTTCKLDR